MSDPTAVGGLAAALGLGDHELVSLVGGGGKTTALFALGRQLNGRTVLTTTTKMGRARTGGRPLLFSPSDRQLRGALDDHGTVLVWGADAGHRATGVEPATCDRWFALADHVVVEADGSRGLPFKAPATHEPVIPAATTLLVACVGAAALGAPIDRGCHRPALVAALADCAAGDVLTPARCAAVLRSPEGSRKGCPPGARFAVLVNQSGPDDRRAVAELRARLDPTPVVAVATFAPGEGPEPGAPVGGCS